MARVMKLWPELPPTSWLTGDPTTWLPLTPGISTPRFWNERPVGTLSITSRVTTTCCCVFCRSTTGDWPDTVIVSATLPTFRSALTAAVNPVVRMMPSRRTALKPPSVKVTV